MPILNNTLKYLAPKAFSTEHILNIFRENYRQQSVYDPEVLVEMKLELTTTIEEWRDICDLVPCKALGRSLNESWGMKASDTQWRAVLEPAKHKTMDEVCTFIAQHATGYEVQPSKWLGGQCIKGGIFLALREILANAGADTHRLKPSASLHEYLQRYPDVFFTHLPKLFPGALPLIEAKREFSSPWLQKILGAAMDVRRLWLSSAIFTMSAILVSLLWSSLAPVLMLLIFTPIILSMMLVDHFLCKWTYRLPHLETFHDLTECLSNPPLWEGYKNEVKI